MYVDNFLSLLLNKLGFQRIAILKTKDSIIRNPKELNLYLWSKENVCML